MDPFTIAFIASQGLQLLSAYQTGEYQKQAAILNREIAELNALNAEHDAYEAVRMGYGKKAQYEAQAADVISKQNIIFAYTDVDTSFGTAAAVQEETRLIGHLNALEITDAAYSQALGYKRQALQYRTIGATQQAAINAQADQQMSAAIIKAGTNTMMNWNKLDFSGFGSSPNVGELDYWSLDNQSPGLAGVSLTDAPQIGNGMGLTLRGTGF